MVADGFNRIFIVLDELNVLDSLLPFLLIFTLVYAIMEKTKIIGEGRKNFNVIVALILSLMVVIPHIMGRFPPGQDPVVIINTALPSVSIVIVAILAVLLLIGIFGKNLDIAGSSLAGWVAIGAFAIVFWIFGSAAGWFGEFPAVFGFLNDPDTQALLIMILVFGLIIMFITSDSGERRITGPFGKILDAFRGAIK
ncbi:hypothetical protein HY640_02995 [Candidatus Woesearchaeota archaeon]|nr:hypothetical protein [Candidatus Woesearchaeota archaeon]